MVSPASFREWVFQIHTDVELPTEHYQAMELTLGYVKEQKDTVKHLRELLDCGPAYSESRRSVATSSKDDSRASHSTDSTITGSSRQG